MITNFHFLDRGYINDRIIVYIWLLIQLWHSSLDDRKIHHTILYGMEKRMKEILSSSIIWNLWVSHFYLSILVKFNSPTIHVRPFEPISQEHPKGSGRQNKAPRHCWLRSLLYEHLNSQLRPKRFPPPRRQTIREDSVSLILFWFSKTCKAPPKYKRRSANASAGEPSQMTPTRNY